MPPLLRLGGSLGSTGCSVKSVCFRMYTEEEARKLGVVGWVKNTSQGTVTGQVQGPEDKVNAMKSWLSKVGSPSSRIDRTSFSNEKEISKLDFSGFSTRY
ncbi:PREDICTED: acylphosphatase-2 isoform X1 [Pygoscelis adeliae]|uniref:acylphosphatase-2 isoform X1 n=1 Tax=Pygoscelis adeliae TaxID=9238 RepID=UPI0004F4F562|nr:PREDICTED: acylphosphatase-2 isoform X1 [Pygoscelis adeliae]